jgi:hypothetical protein
MKELQTRSTQLGAQLECRKLQAQINYGSGRFESEYAEALKYIEIEVIMLATKRFPELFSGTAASCQFYRDYCQYL